MIKACFAAMNPCAKCLGLWTCFSCVDGALPIVCRHRREYFCNPIASNLRQLSMNDTDFANIIIDYAAPEASALITQMDSLDVRPSIPVSTLQLSANGPHMRLLLGFCAVVNCLSLAPRE